MRRNYVPEQPNHEEQAALWNQLPEGLTDWSLRGVNMGTPRASSMHSHSPAESAVTGSSYDSQYEAEQDPSFSQPQSAPPAPHIYASAPDQSTPLFVSGTPDMSGTWDASPHPHGGGSEVLSPGFFLPPYRGSSEGSANKGSWHSQPSVSAQPSPAAQPPYPAPHPYQHGEYSGAQSTGQYFNPHQQAGRQPKRTYDHLSPSSEEGQRRKGKQRQVSPWQEQGGQGQTSASGAGQAFYDLTESPGRGASFIDPSQAGGGYGTQTWGESSTQNAPQPQYDPAGGINPGSLLINQYGPGAGFTQPQGESSFPAISRPPGAPIAARAPPVTGESNQPSLHRSRIPWQFWEKNLLEDIVSGYPTLDAAARHLEETMQRTAGACKAQWSLMNRSWKETENNYLRRFAEEPEDWDAFAQEYNRIMQAYAEEHKTKIPEGRSAAALRAHYRLLVGSNDPHDLGNSRV